MTFAQFLGTARKAVVNAVGMGTALLSLGLLPEPYAKYVAIVVALGTVVLHYNVSNDDLPIPAQATTADRAQEPAESPVEPLPAPVEGEVLDPFPKTVEIPVQAPETAGIPLIEGEPADDPQAAEHAAWYADPNLTVQDILARLNAEQGVHVA